MAPVTACWAETLEALEGVEMGMVEGLKDKDWAESCCVCCLSTYWI